MKKFEDLQFESHPLSGIQAKLNFPNGYGVSVISGQLFRSNGIDTYELAVLKDGSICYDSGITTDVMGNLSENEVTKVMKKVQKLE